MRNCTIKKLAPNKYYLDARLYKNGVVRRLRKMIYGSLREAEAGAVELTKMVEEQLGSIPTSINTYQNMMFAEEKTYRMCSEFYCKIKKPNKGDLSYLRRLENELGDYSISDIPSAYREFISMLSVSKTVKGVPYSASALMHFDAWIKAVLNFAVNEELIDEFPFKKRFMNRKVAPRSIKIQRKDMNRFLEVVKVHRPRILPIAIFLSQVPCRKGDLLYATRSLLNLDERTVRIPCYDPRLKISRSIEKPVPPELYEYFKSIPIDCPWLFYRESNGEYFPLKVLDKDWDFCRKIAGLKDENFGWIRIHDTRHYSASNFADDGLPERQIMTLAGWSTNMLSTYYGKDMEKSVQNAHNILNQRWSKSEEP